MSHVLVPYTVKPEYVNKVKAIVEKFITEIQKNEPDTLFYKSFQQSDTPTNFVHIMTFTNAAAEKLHKNSSYCREFTDALYPLCSVMPRPIAHKEIMS